MAVPAATNFAARNCKAWLHSWVMCFTQHRAWIFIFEFYALTLLSGEEEARAMRQIKNIKIEAGHLFSQTSFNSAAPVGAGTGDSHWAAATASSLPSIDHISSCILGQVMVIAAFQECATRITYILSWWLARNGYGSRRNIMMLWRVLCTLTKTTTAVLAGAVLVLTLALAAGLCHLANLYS